MDGASVLFRRVDQLPRLANGPESEPSGVSAIDPWSGVQDAVPTGNVPDRVAVAV